MCLFACVCVSLPHSAAGCLDPQCMLCQHNPQRRCLINFDRKYLVHDILKAKCGATIRVELVDKQTNTLITDDVHGLKIEVRVDVCMCLCVHARAYHVAYALRKKVCARACVCVCVCACTSVCTS